MRPRAPHYRANPPWTNSAITGHWGRIVKRAKQLDSEELAPAQMPSSSVIAREAREYGKGQYGVVFPTGIPGTVAKITTDLLEAEFIQAAIGMAKKNGWPAGIAEFDAIYLMDGAHVAKLPDGTTERRRMFFTWREEAYEVGGLLDEQARLQAISDAGGTVPGTPTARARSPSGSYTRGAPSMRRRQIGAAREQLRLCKNLGQDVRMRVLTAERESERALRTLLEKAEREREWALNSIDMDSLDDPTFYNETGPRRVALFRAAYEIVAKDVARIPVVPEVGKAMHYYCERGIMLPDIHMNNIGEVERKGKRVHVITDAGQAIFFDPDHEFGTIPRL